MSEYDLLACVLCGGTGWSSPYSVPNDPNDRSAGLRTVYVPCSDHPLFEVPDVVEIQQSERRRPKLGVDFVVVRDVCLAGEPAINGRCGDLTCVCAPTPIRSMSRVWRYEPSPEYGDGMYYVVEDQGDTITVQPLAGGKMHLRVPKNGWGLVGIQAFPADDPRGKAA